MNIREIQSILNSMVERSQNWVQNNVKIPNERVYHHLFSSLLTEHCNDKGLDIWESLIISPEHKTEQQFSWSEVQLGSVTNTRKKALGNGRAGNIDLAILDKKTIFIEWKGPQVFKKKDVAQTVIKLLSQKDKAIKILAAITITTPSGRKNHMDTNTERLQEEIDFACKVLRLKKPQNFYVYVTCVDREECHRIHWGKY
ncbi:hypothetical protein [Candidatus Uabimicrobium amorphum]|uniref:Restriction endonuclease n=1 Tax=Uabimicrobium amorphum TaxID=2596890 RepID=A0A5S9IKT3_UABAM|nr:hypothetical protein [Candidatus Uabimicrobium amorphum]BBM83357.1 hypothetical protein UABAM_01709 [Candidatus Uabimicrobium amorphum]